MAALLRLDIYEQDLNSVFVAEKDVAHEGRRRKTGQRGWFKQNEEDEMAAQGYILVDSIYEIGCFSSFNNVINCPKPASPKSENVIANGNVIGRLYYD